MLYYTILYLSYIRYILHSWLRLIPTTVGLSPNRKPLGVSRSLLVALLGVSWTLLGGSWGLLGGSWGLLEPPKEALGASKRVQEPPKRVQEPPKRVQDTLKSLPRDPQEAPKTHFGPSWRPLGGFKASKIDSKSSYCKRCASKKANM